MGKKHVEKSKSKKGGKITCTLCMCNDGPHTEPQICCFDALSRAVSCHAVLRYAIPCYAVLTQP